MLFRSILKRRSFYRDIFQSISGEAVLADLRQFCKAGQPALVVGRDGQTDVYATGMVAGRQEVFWRIVTHLNMDDSKLLNLKDFSNDGN